MIAIIGLQAAVCPPGAEILQHLPEPPAMMWSGFLVAGSSTLPIARILDWGCAVKEERPAAHVVISPDPASPPWTNALVERLGFRVVAGVDCLQVRNLVESVLAQVGAQGGQVRRVCRELGVSTTTLYRQLEESRLPPPGTLLREARIRGVELRVQRGVSRTAALEAAGWFDHKAFLMVRARALRQREARAMPPVRTPSSGQCR